jgi:hypothetical protein
MTLSLDKAPLIAVHCSFIPLSFMEYLASDFLIYALKCDFPLQLSFVRLWYQIYAQFNWFFHVFPVTETYFVIYMYMYTYIYKYIYRYRYMLFLKELSNKATGSLSTY